MTEETGKTLVLSTLTPHERDVFNRAMAALSLPLSAREMWFYAVACAMVAANKQLGWNGRNIN